MDAAENPCIRGDMNDGLQKLIWDDSFAHASYHLLVQLSGDEPVPMKQPLDTDMWTQEIVPNKANYMFFGYLKKDISDIVFQ